jgi:hypothetical protein
MNFMEVWVTPYGLLLFVQHITANLFGWPF